jgi:DNA polymerase-1
LEEKYPILQKIRYYKLMTKMLSTYLQPAAEGSWKSADGRVRTTYNLHGTKTGRISSGGDVKDRTKINLLNIPTPEKEPNTLLQILPIKNLFTHSYMRNGICRTKADFQTKFRDGAMISIDESGMELRVFGSLAKCYAMIDIHKSGRDFHSTVAIMAQTGKRISEVTDDDIAGLNKSVRYIYKWTSWSLLYGGGKDTLVNLYNLSDEEAEAIVEEYYACFPEVLDYKQQCIRFAEEHGYIESPFGRRERLYYINDDGGAKRNADRRACINMPVQSAAGDTVLMAAIIIDAKIREAGLRTKLVNTVYDSVLLDAPRDEVVTVSLLAKDVMENVVDYAKIHTPDIDFSWLISPLAADVDVGSHYGSMTSLVKWQEANHVYE